MCNLTLIFHDTQAKMQRCPSATEMNKARKYNGILRSISHDTYDNGKPTVN